MNSELKHELDSVEIKLRSIASSEVESLENVEWEYKLEDDWIIESSISIERYTFPDYYFLQYKGNNTGEKAVLEELNIIGKYLKQKNTNRMVPYFIKEDVKTY